MYQKILVNIKERFQLRIHEQSFIRELREKPLHNKKFIERDIVFFDEDDVEHLQPEMYRAKSEIIEKDFTDDFFKLFDINKVKENGSISRSGTRIEQFFYD